MQSNSLQSNCIQSNSMQSNSLQSNCIQSNSMQSNSLQSNCIQSNSMQSNSLQSDNLKLNIQWNIARLFYTEPLEDLNKKMYCAHRNYFRIKCFQGIDQLPIDPKKISFTCHFADNEEELIHNNRGQNINSRLKKAIEFECFKLENDDSLLFRVLINVSSFNFSKKLFFLKINLLENNVGENTKIITSWKSSLFEAIGRRPSDFSI
jgi:hypothetical protein